MEEDRGFLPCSSAQSLYHKNASAIAALMMGAVDGQVVLFPTGLAKGDAAIRELIRMLEER